VGHGARARDRRSAPRGSQRGQSIVEFALVAPLMLLLMFGILDLARIYTTMMSVESAAREAADYGTTLGAERWQPGAFATTVAEMHRRACVAASDLPDYVGVDADADGIDEDCTNPTFQYCMTPSTGGTCGALNPADSCDDPVRDPPCTLTVTLSYVFHLFVPFHVDFFGVQLGLPATLAFDRDSTFAMTDITVAATPGP
jgi:Flp pilus assembly protein TadG